MLHVISAIFISSCILYAGCQNDVGYGPPRILFETSDTKEIDTGDSFKLECESDRPIYWLYPNITDPEEGIQEDNYDTVINIFDSVTSTGQHRSVISVTSANYQDTGFYSCIANESLSLDDTNDFTRIYVYVKDLNNLLVREHFVVLPVVQYKPAVIPCRPTSPDVNITLLKDYQEVHLGIQESDHMNVTFHPKIGFTLTPINYKHSGLYECVASLGDVEASQQYHVDVMRASSSIPKPQINESAVHPVMAGSSLYLECVGMASPGISFSFKWYGLGKEITKGGRISINGPVPFKKCGKDLYKCHMSSLTIRDVRVSDAGRYTCLVIDHNGITNNDTQEIKIHEPGVSYINLTHDGVDFNVSANKPNVTWMIRVDSSISPYEYKWLDQYGNKIDPENKNNKYKIEVKKNYQQIMLVIYDVQVKDTGTYEFTAYHGNTTKSLNLTLIVREKPTVELEGSGNMYYQLGQNYTLDCKVVGYPAPRLKWSFLDCDLMSECKETNFETLKDVTDLKLDKEIYQYYSKYTFTVTKPGLLKCYADNSEGNGSDVMSIFVTDIPLDEGVGIWGKPDNVVEGDTIKLSCGATKYNFSDDISWWVTRRGYDDKFPIENKTDEQYVVRNDTLYSYRAELILMDLKLKSDANYYCKTMKNDNDFLIMKEEIIVLENCPDIGNCNNISETGGLETKIIIEMLVLLSGFL